MDNFLLIDFGASRVKAAMINIRSGIFSQAKDFPPSANIATVAGHFEIAPQEIHKQFLEIASHYSTLSSIDGIFLCSQMHGFIALDENQKPLSNYISWKDERSLEQDNSKISTFDFLQNQLGPKFKQITGIKPRPSFPFFNAAHWAKKQGIKKAALITLPDWLAMISGRGTGAAHSTMLAGLGFYDIYKNQISHELVALAKEFSCCEFSFNKPASHNQIAGYWTGKTSKIPIYAGVGDHQCAVLGAGNLPGKTISVNIGTGSQVSVIDVKPQSEEVEYRPYFNNSTLATITHIPAGRALEFYIKGFADKQNIQAENLWQLFSSVVQDDAESSQTNINLAVFPSARGFNPVYKPEDIFKQLSDPKLFLAGLVKALAKQYAEVINIFDPKTEIPTIQLSGGVARKLLVLAPIFHKLTNRQVLPAAEIDETFLGLKNLFQSL